MDSVEIELPAKLHERVFAKPRGEVRFRGAYGGRGSGKSFSFAKMAAIYGYIEPTRILFTREIQESIRQSSYAELKRVIESEPFLNANYMIGDSYIRGKNGTEFLFKGLRHNIQSIRSTSGVGLCVVEEAEDVPEKSWVDLIPTIRDPGSEIWMIWNPRAKGSPVDIRFRQNQDADMAICELNYSDNPWFPDVLEKERIRDRRNLDPGTYAHIWEGAYLELSDSQILNGKWRIDEFYPTSAWDGPYFGADWGFASDPTALVKLWIHERVLYVEYEAYAVGVEIDHTPALFDTVPGSRHHVIRADSARPETISYMRRQGFNIRAAEKGPGSVEDGIAHLRSYDEIVIHPRCINWANEARLYSYKVDRLSGDILPVPIDAHNHLIDGSRYALEPIMKNRKAGYAGIRT